MALATERRTTVAWLVPVAGPALDAIELSDRTGGLLIGRSDVADIRLPVDSISRSHARVLQKSGQWRIVDLGSRWGTFVNGVQLVPHREMALQEGDLVRMTPWTFRFSAMSSTRAGVLDGAMDSLDDTTQTSTALRTIALDQLPSLGDEMLMLLVDAAGKIHSACDEKGLSEALLEHATRGSGLPNAAVLRPAGVGGRFEVVASKFATHSPAFSRSLLNAAAQGQVAELSADQQDFDASQSIVSMGVRSALCVPLMLGQTVAAYLYLDSRGDPNSVQRLPLRPNASSFCAALGKMGALAMANLKRIEMEQRAVSLEADLKAAAAAQQWILPKPTGTFGPFRYSGKSQPGEYVGGDFYDILALGPDRLAVAIGDVSGHGVAASVLMTASAGFLHGVLEDTADAVTCINRLNTFVGPRRPVDRFMTLWLGILDRRTCTLEYIDAGHSYAIVSDESGKFQELAGQTTQVPIGIDDDFRYTSTKIPLGKSGRLLVFSDGLVEQQSQSAERAGQDQFSMTGVMRVTQAAGSGADLVNNLFSAVIEHAGQKTLTDDATAVLVEWEF